MPYPASLYHRPFPPPPVYLHVLSNCFIRPLSFSFSSHFPSQLSPFPSFNYKPTMNASLTSIPINQDLFVSFIDLFNTSEFRNRFALNNLNLKEIFPLGFQVLWKPTVKLASINHDMMPWWQSHRMNQLMFIFMFKWLESKGFNVLRTEQLPLIQHASTSMALYCQKEEGINRMFPRALVDRKLTTCYVNGSCYIK